MLASMRWIMIQVLRIASVAAFNQGRHNDHPCHACLGSETLRRAADEMERA